MEDKALKIQALLLKMKALPSDPKLWINYKDIRFYIIIQKK